ncbi:hypothetical protein QYM36_001822, partial [Artemia franciscana]
PIYILQGIFIILTISTNGIMMVLFFRALAGSETTFLVTAMNSAANFATTSTERLPKCWIIPSETILRRLYPEDVLHCILEE